MEFFEFVRKTIIFPLKQAYRLQQKVQIAVQNTAESSSSALSQRAFDKTVRDEQMALDHLEEHCMCCVCQQQGEEVASRRKKDGGLKILEGQDAAILSAALGQSMRGYLCPTCDVIRTKLKMRLQAKQALRARDALMQAPSNSSMKSSSSNVLRGGRLQGADGASLAAAHEEFLAGAGGLGASGMAAGPLAEGLFRGVTAWPTDKPLDIGIVAAGENATLKIASTDSVVLMFQAKNLKVYVPEYDGVSSNTVSSSNNNNMFSPLPSGAFPATSEVTSTTFAAAAAATRELAPQQQQQQQQDAPPSSSSNWVNLHVRMDEYRVFFKLHRVLPSAISSSSASSGRHHQANIDQVYESECVLHESRKRRKKKGDNSSSSGIADTPTPASPMVKPSSSSSSSVVEWEKTAAIPVPKLCGRDCASTFVLQVYAMECDSDKRNNISNDRSTAFDDDDDSSARQQQQQQQRQSEPPQLVGRCNFRMEDLTRGTREPVGPLELIDTETGEARGTVTLAKVVLHRYIANIDGSNTITGSGISGGGGETGGGAGDGGGQSLGSLVSNIRCRGNEVPAWAVAALRERKCDVCRSRGVELFHRRYRELLCAVCRAARAHGRECVPIGSSMPDHTTAVALTMAVVDRRPNERLDPGFQQSRSLFPPTNIDLFLQQERIFATAPPVTSTPAPAPRILFSQAGGLLAQDQDVDERRLRTATLFAGRSELAHQTDSSSSSSSSSSVPEQSLFAEYWKAGPPPEKLIPANLIEATMAKLSELQQQPQQVSRPQEAAEQQEPAPVTPFPPAASAQAEMNRDDNNHDDADNVGGDGEVAEDERKYSEVRAGGEEPFQPKQVEQIVQAADASRGRVVQQ